MAPRPIVLAIVGPTGSGKTELAVALARRVGAEIIGADSMQVYRGMDIGTAKPSLELRREIPHHCIDVVDPDDRMSAGRYAELARGAAWEIHARGRPIVLCGGTGLYVRVFAGGLIPNAAPDPALRERLGERATQSLRQELERRDPEAARQIAPGDRVRLERALEALATSGWPTSALRAEHGFGDRPFDVRMLGLELDRSELVRRIEARVDEMLRVGWIDEVRSLRARGYGPELHSMRALGYRELGQVLDGCFTLEQARDRIVVATRRYAKRQRTWFRAERGLRWVDAAVSTSMLPLAEALLRGGSSG